MNTRFDKIDVSVKEVLSTIDSKHADVTRAILRANSTVCKLKQEGMSLMNSSELVSTLMKNLAMAKSISGADKKSLVMKVMKEVVATCPEAEMILAMTPTMVDNFCTLIKKKKTIIVLLKEKVMMLLSTCLAKSK